MSDLDLAPPGLIVNSMKGDPDEHRAAGWLAWDGNWLGLKAAVLGVPFDGASVVRSGARHGPDAVRQSFMFFTNFSSLDEQAMTGFRAADIGAESSGVPFRKALELPGSPIAGCNLVQIGIAEFANSPQLAAYAREMGVTVFPQLAVERQGMAAIVEQALDLAGEGADAIYLSVDIDCIDQSQAPGTAAPNPSGLDAREVQAALRRIASHPKMIGFDLVEIAPPFDVQGITGRTGAALVLNVLYGLASRSAAG